MLTRSTLLLVDFETGDFEIIAPANKAEAMRWVSGGQIMMFGNDTVTFLRPGDRPESAPFVIEYDGFFGLDVQVRPWLAATSDGDTLAIGMGNQYQIFDAALRAPLTSVAPLPDLQINHVSGSLRLEADPSGEIRLFVNGRKYVRAAKLAGEPSAFLDPNAPFRQ